MYQFLTRSPLILLALTLMMTSMARAQLLVKNSTQSEIFRVTATGNLGIMTTNPGSRLAVNGRLNIGGYNMPDNYDLSPHLAAMHVGIGITNASGYVLYVNGSARINELNINGAYTFETAIGTTNQYLNGLGKWSLLPADNDGVIGNEITAVTDGNSTLTRSGSGTAVAPYTVGLNLANPNTWTAVQTFNAGANFSTSTNSGTWNNSGGNLGVGVTNPGARLSVNGGVTIGNVYLTTPAPTNGLLVEGFVGINTTRPRAQLYSYCTPGLDLVNISILGEAYSTVDSYPAIGVIGSVNFMTNTASSGQLPRAGVHGGLTGDIYTNVHFPAHGDLGMIRANTAWLGWQTENPVPARDHIMGVYGGIPLVNEEAPWRQVAINARRAAVLAVNENSGLEDYGLWAYGPHHYIEGEFFVRGETIKGTGNSTWVVASDGRLKDVDGAFDKGLEEIMALQTIRYHFKTDNGLQLPSDQEHSGFIAQDVEKVIPEAVQRHESGYLTMNYDPILLSMVNAVKELKAKNNQLRADIQKMQNQ